VIKLDIFKLRNAVSQNRYFITTHAKERMGQRQVADADIIPVIGSGDVIESYADATPYPKALFMAQVQGEPLYVSCAFDGTYAHIITVHWYDPNRWVDPWTRRRQ